MTSISSDDPRRAIWRRGSYEIVGDWLRPASLLVLDLVSKELGRDLSGLRVLAVATGTGAGAIEAARRGADVVGLDLTDELLQIARVRAADAEVVVRFIAGDFDRIDDVLEGEQFDLITSSFGVIFSPGPASTLRELSAHLAPEGLVSLVGWEPGGVFLVPDSLLELLPERPVMPDMACWTNDIEQLAATVDCDVVAHRVGDLPVEFRSLADAAEQIEWWSGGWAQLLEMFDGMGVGNEARRRFVDHLAGHASETDAGVALAARHHVSVLRPI